MRIISKSEWGARPPKCQSSMIRSDGLHVHHTTGSNLGREDCAAWVRSIQSYHMDSRGWCDIGYSFLICKHGDIYVGRDWGVAGAHTVGYNETSHGIAYLGDGSQEVPEEAISAYQYLVDKHAEHYGAGYVYGHRDRASTACPGDKLYERLPDIREGLPLYKWVVRWRVRHPDGKYGPVVKRRKAHRRFHWWLKRTEPGEFVGLKKVRRKVPR